MSWSFNGVGRPLAVVAKMRKDCSRSHCPEPEQTIRAALVDIVEAALTAYPPDQPVVVEASGSQGSNEGGIINQLKLDIKPLYGFLDYTV